MQSVKRGLFLLAAILPAVLGAPVQETRRAAQKIPGKYIVTLKDGLSDSQVAAHTFWATEVHARRLARRDPNERDLPAGILKRYKIESFNAYAGAFDDLTIDEIRNNPDVCLALCLFSFFFLSLDGHAPYLTLGM